MMLSASVRGAGFSQILAKFGQLKIGDQCRYATTIFPHGMGNRHRDPKWKKHRANKVFKVKLPEYENMRARMNGKITPAEMKAEFKKSGVAPMRRWDEKPAFMSTLSGVVEPYVPPEGDGKASLLSKSGALQKMEQLKKKSTFLWHLRKVKQFEPEFKVAEFAIEAHDIYVKAHETLAEGDKEKLITLVTEGVYPEMISNAKLKTLRWKMIGSLEPARVVHVRTQHMLTEDNVFAQITVRMHTQQTLAVYDRFGRLIHGSEVMVKDVLEYVVFEKQIANLYGQWRLHAKIIPDWQPRKEPSRRTFVAPDEQDATTAPPETVMPDDDDAQKVAQTQ